MPDQGSWPLQWGVVIGASLVAALIDLWRRRIPNWLTFPLLLAGLIVAGVTGGWGGLWEAVKSMALMMAPFVALFIWAGGGAGDAKLMGALGTWLGLHDSVVVLLAVCICGVIIGVIFSLTKKKLLQVVHNLLLIIYGFLFNMASRAGWRGAGAILKGPSNMETIPYGVAIFLGVCAGAVEAILWPIA